ncbi:MAG: ATP-binding protein [Planctomycetaceae bacterium]|nr:ATP-binding protein [Planctomycetaceae bacterium]
MNTHKNKKPDNAHRTGSVQKHTQKRRSANKLLIEQNIFVVAAFATMVIISYLFVSRIISDQMNAQCRSTFTNTYHHVSSIFNTLEMIVLNLASDVEIAFNTGQSAEEIHEYLKIAIAHERFPSKTQEYDNKRVFKVGRFYNELEYTGPYCELNGQRIDAIYWIPPEGYDVRERPWYQEIKEGNGELVYSSPFMSLHTNELAICLGKALFANIDGERTFFGVLSIDIEMDKIADLIEALQYSSRGYAVLITPSGKIAAHYNHHKIGKHVSDTSFGTILDDDNLASISRSHAYPTRFSAPNENGIWCIFDCGFLKNGWLVASVIPIRDFNRQVHLVAIILAVVGSIMAGSLCFFLTKLSREKFQADSRSQNKSIFLAKMSHEIRTPMNVISGLSRFIAREKGQLPPKVAKYSAEIHHAANNLLAIINNVLDMSKVESGQLEVTKISFTLSSLLEDVLNITQTRLFEKDLQFVSFVDSQLPNHLLGDVVFIRQILLNVLSNAGKYTKNGHVALDVLGTRTDAKTVMFSFIVQDTGIGIKASDLPNLFDDYTQFNTENNWNIEGTGLGLAICKELVDRLGGTIAVTSSPGQGSTFTVTLPIEIEYDTPCLGLHDMPQHHAMLYEPRPVYEQSLIRTLNHLGMSYKSVQNVADLEKALQTNRTVSLAFIAPAVFAEVSPVLKRFDVQVILLCETSEQNQSPYVQSLMLPVNALRIAQCLNVTQSGLENYADFEVPFRMPAAKILIVDDYEPNFMVAEEFLAPYECQLDFVMNGHDALMRFQTTAYDLVFMDHMMPDMDGIETALHIRKLEERISHSQNYQPVPIVALTANAVVGMKEEFMQNGMNDILPKPIDPVRLNEILSAWIPKDKQLPANMIEKKPTKKESIQIHGIDTQTGIFQTGGTLEGYIRVLNALCGELDTKLDAMDKALTANDLSAYRIYAHNYKNLLAIIGLNPLSVTAASLESAAKDADRVVVEHHHHSFTRELHQAARAIKVAIDARKNLLGRIDDSIEGQTWLNMELTQLKSSIEESRMQQADAIIDRIQAKQWAPEISERLEKITQSIILFEWPEAIDQIDELQRKILA